MIYNSKHPVITSILYADDDEDDCQHLREVLSELNFNGRVSIVNDGKEMLEKINDERFEMPSIIFLDVLMPFLSGVECLEIIRKDKRYNDVPVIMLTSIARPATIVLCFDKKASRYIVKPKSINKLKKLVHRVMQMEYKELVNPEKNNFLLV